MGTPNEKVTPLDSSVEPVVKLDLASQALDSQAREVKLSRVQSIHVGPLPTPEAFEKYEQTCPGAASRILSMAETEASERHLANQKALDATIKDTRRGMYLAFFLAILLIFGGFVLLILDKYIAGSAFSIAGLMIVFRAFIGDRNKSIDEKEEIE